MEKRTTLLNIFIKIYIFQSLFSNVVAFGYPQKSGLSFTTDTYQYQVNRGNGVLNAIKNTCDEVEVSSKTECTPINSITRGELFSNTFKSIIPLVTLATTDMWAVPTLAISPQTAASSYDTYAPSYDSLDGGDAAAALGIDDARQKLLFSAKGDILEIGVGTGLNIPNYPFSSQQITSITFLDVSDGMLQQAKLKAKANIPENVKVTFIQADATSQLKDLFGENTFDTVLDTFSLCVMGTKGAEACLSQMRSVVKKESDGGMILLLENSRSSNPLLGWYQDLTAEAAASSGGKGCVYNQDVGSMILRNNLVIKEENQFAAGLFRSFVCTHS